MNMAIRFRRPGQGKLLLTILLTALVIGGNFGLATAALRAAGRSRHGEFGDRRRVHRGCRIAARRRNDSKQRGRRRTSLPAGRKGTEFSATAFPRRLVHGSFGPAVDGGRNDWRGKISIAATQQTFSARPRSQPGFAQPVPGGLDPREAYKLCQKYPSSASYIIRSMLTRVGRPQTEIENAVNEASQRRSVAAEPSRFLVDARGGCGTTDRVTGNGVGNYPSVLRYDATGRRTKPRGSSGSGHLYRLGHDHVRVVNCDSSRHPGSLL